MTLNCLTCQSIPRTNSDKEGENLRLGLGKFERSSRTGNLGLPRPNINNCEKMKTLRSASSLVPPKNVVKNKAPLRFHSSGSIGSFNEEEEPKLVRSCGMRRDWSFEDLRQMAKASKVEIWSNSHEIKRKEEEKHCNFFFSFVYICYVCYIVYKITAAWNSYMFGIKIGKETRMRFPFPFQFPISVNFPFSMSFLLDS